MSQDNEDPSSDESSVSLSDEESKIIKLKDKKERIFIEFMTHSNEYVKLRHQMNVHLARGHLNMARATRSNMNTSPRKFNRNKNIFNKEMSAISTVTTDKKETFTLHRNKTKSVDDDALVDPLKWFGAMVPKSVCTAQTDFTNCIPLVVEMANVKQKLDALSLKWDA
eukprot:503902_1